LKHHDGRDRQPDAVREQQSLPQRGRYAGSGCRADRIGDPCDA
jgi:hypothetical protein